MIDHVEIDTDENGFTLILTGDFVDECERYLADDKAGTITLRLGDAEGLLRETLRQIFPWVAEKEAARVEFDRATPEERARVILDARDRDDGELWDEHGGASPDEIAEGVDLLRKMERENR